MATVAALFSSQAEATKALDAMAGTEFEDIETTVYEQGQLGGEGAPQVRIATSPSSPGGMPGGVIPTEIGDVVNRPIGELSDPAVSEYFVREVEERGATLVVAAVDGEHADDLERFFREHGGQTTEEA